MQAIYPFVSPGGLGGAGPFIGRELLGGSFCFDPWDLYRRGVLTNPNVLVVGQIGRGKSTFIKTFVWRQLAFGRRAWILDPKGEYGPLAAAAGTAPLKLVPGGRVRLNPLGLPAGPRDQASAAQRRVALVCSLVESSLGRPLGPGERTALDLACRAVSRASSQPTLPDLVAALLDPAEDLAASVRTDVRGLSADGRPAALELRRLVEGDLAGMFDGPTSHDLDSGTPIVVLDLSAVYGSPALPLLMTCATSWLQAFVAADERSKRIVVVDEAWAVLKDLATARWLQASFKLSRAIGVANLAVVHRFSDLGAVGAGGSAQERLAEGLLADSETRVVFGQSPSEAELCGRLLGLSKTEQELVGRLPRGVALWKVGERSFLVEHALAPPERPVVDTDQAMTEESSQ